MTDPFVMAAGAVGAKDVTKAECPYCATDIYVKRKVHLGVFDLKNKKDEKETPRV